MLQKPTRKEEKDLKLQQKQFDANEKASKVIDAFKADRLIDESEDARNEDYQASRGRAARMPIYLSDQSDEDQEGLLKGQKKPKKSVSSSAPAFQEN